MNHIQIKEKPHSKFWILWTIVVIGANVYFFSNLIAYIYKFFYG